MSTRQPVDAEVSDAEIATLIPKETARSHLAAVLGQVAASPSWGGQARSPGLNGRRRQRRERRMQANVAQSTKTGPHRIEKAPPAVTDLSDTAPAEGGHRAPIHAVVPPPDGTQGSCALHPAPPAATDRPMASQTRRLIEGPIAPTFLVFAGALSCWLLNTLASIVRGTGTMLLPASVIIGGGIVTLVVSPALVLGWSPLPQLGIAGAAVGFITYYSLGSLVLLGYLCSGRSLVRFTMSGFRFRRAVFWEILHVGAPASLNSLLTHLNMMLLTGLVGHFGMFALAGYGMGLRLEYL
jgi:hypothetical protein